MSNNHIMREAILNFAKQFEFEPEIQNEEKLTRSDHVILAGMGGSHLAGDILRTATLPCRISIHQDYGLPPGIPEKELRESLVLANSYSGNTEETLDAFETAHNKELSVAVIATGGKLLEKARAAGVPFIQAPDAGIQPRAALGFNFRAVAKMLGLENIIRETRELADTLKPAEWEHRGQNLAEKLAGKVPVIYASQKNYAVAYNWKIKLNETGKIPAFYNLLPELNHNEMNGFDAPYAQELSKNFYFIFLTDSTDHPQVTKRMGVVEKLYTERGFTVEKVALEGKNHWEKVFSSLLLADWTAYSLAESHSLEANDVPMIEEFKKLIRA